METTLKLVKKIDVIGSLLSIKKGETVTVLTKDIKSTAVRSAAKRLCERGYDFKVTEAGLVNEVKVMRLK